MKWRNTTCQNSKPENSENFLSFEWSRTYFQSSEKWRDWGKICQKRLLFIVQGYYITWQHSFSPELGVFTWYSYFLYWILYAQIYDRVSRAVSSFPLNAVNRQLARVELYLGSCGRLLEHSFCKKILQLEAIWNPDIISNDKFDYSRTQIVQSFYIEKISRICDKAGDIPHKKICFQCTQILQKCFLEALFSKLFTPSPIIKL